MAACIPAAGCGHTAPDAVVCSGGGEDCAGSACLACAEEGKDEVLLGLLPGGAAVFTPGFDGFTQCYECREWECAPCHEDTRAGQTCDCCAAYCCSACSSAITPGHTVVSCEGCNKTVCEGCNHGDRHRCIYACACGAGACEDGCADDWKQCSHCKQWSCPQCCLSANFTECTYRGCVYELCDYQLCEDCSEAYGLKCSVCSEVFACGHSGNDCGICDEFSCTMCQKRCSECGQRTCANCLANERCRHCDAAAARAAAAAAVAGRAAAPAAPSAAAAARPAGAATSKSARKRARKRARRESGE